ncbi:MAG: DUF1697 domain-containing protein [Gemmatimonadota bacterium]
MPKYVAFLRGINVGGHRVKMDRLREIFEEMGLADVSTFIASGNVIFSVTSTDVDQLTKNIERHLEQRLGYSVLTFLRSPAELDAIAAFEPAEVGEGQHPDPSLYVSFLREPADPDLRATFAGLRSEMDEFRFSQREIYWMIQGKLSESPLFGSGIERATRGIPNTARNVTTLRRLVARLAEQGDAQERDGDG